MNYLGLDVHKRTISYCVRHPDGSVLQEGCISASREALDTLIAQLPGPCLAGTEATLFTAWVYDYLSSMGIQVKVAHPAMLKAIFAGKRKNDEIDARKLADLLRCNYFPECHIASREIRDRRRVLRYRNVLVRQSTQTKNKMAAMLMETGIPYNKQQLHRSKKYFENFVEAKASMMPEGLPGLLRLGRNVIDVLRSMDRQLVRMLETDAALTDRIARLMTVPGVGVILALTWALEMGDVSRFSCAKAAISYCGLCGAEQSSAGKSQRTPISKQRNKHLQTILIEPPKVAPRWHPEFALLYDQQKQKGNRNRATLAIARKLVAYLLAVDKGDRTFLPQAPSFVNADSAAA
jgi:transposase